jgi:thioredoxin reductase (NADPH)
MSSPETVPIAQPPNLSPEKREQLFPKLSQHQVDHIAALPGARKRSVAKDELLINQGDVPPFFVVIHGRIDIFQSSNTGEILIVQHREREFTGEMNMLSGRRSLAGARMGEAGEIIELDRESLQNLVQNDVGIGQILMTAFIWRRLELIEQHAGT